MTRYCGRMTVNIVGFTEIQEAIRDNCPEEYFTLIMRRFMMRLANMLALELRCRALVTGENLGQVASQTMQALADMVQEDVQARIGMLLQSGVLQEQGDKVSAQLEYTGGEVKANGKVLDQEGLMGLMAAMP